MPELWVSQLGCMPYPEALDLQRELHSRRAAGELPDLLLVLEHPPVYTKGRRSEPADLPMGESWYRGQGIDVCETDRGGRVTYHGPGQLVAYPIMAVERVADFVRGMESAIVSALADEGVAATREGDGLRFSDHVRVTALSAQTGRIPALPCFRKRLAYCFAEAFGLRQRLVSPARLRERPKVAA